jgi:hypothetical protein
VIAALAYFGSVSVVKKKSFQNWHQMVEGDHDQVSWIGTHQDLMLDRHDHQVVQLQQVDQPLGSGLATWLHDHQAVQLQQVEIDSTIDGSILSDILAKLILPQTFIKKASDNFG